MPARRCCWFRELDEIRSLSDRILVMFAGRIVGDAAPRPAKASSSCEGGRGAAGVCRMSTPYAKLPAWADYG